MVQRNRRGGSSDEQMGINSGLKQREQRHRMGWLKVEGWGGVGVVVVVRGAGAGGVVVGAGIAGSGGVWVGVAGGGELRVWRGRILVRAGANDPTDGEHQKEQSEAELLGEWKHGAFF